jgi:spermidine synthase
VCGRPESFHKNVSKRPTPVFLLLFFISGGCALIYEVVWTRLFTIVIGNTVFSVSAILTAFMAGLALGSRLAGRIIDTRRLPLIRAYAALEAAIGLYNLALPLLLKAADPLFGFIYAQAYQSPLAIGAARLIISCSLLILPATLMGATLPILVRFFVEHFANTGVQAGRIYSVNTVGGAVGAAAAGFVLVPFSGVIRTLIIGAMLNLSIAVAAWLLSRKHESYSITSRIQDEPLPASPGTGGRPRIVLIAMFLSGLAALIDEVAWTRVLGLVLGPTTYAFTLMLCSIITGLGLGAAIGSYWTRRFAIRPNTLAWIEVLIGLTSLALVPAFGRLPLWIARLVIRYTEAFGSIQVFEFLLIFALMLVPTTLLGMTFPVASKLYARSDSQVGNDVSAVYAANTIGGIAGSLVAGFILVPYIGSQSALMAAALVSAAAGVLLALRQRAVTAVALLLLPVVFLIPRWSPELMASGAYKYAPYISTLDLESVLTSGDLLYFKEGATTTVSAKRYRGRVSLSVNGKVDATDAGDMLTQKMLAHLPLLLSKTPKKVAVIGLGSGVTAGAALKHPIDKLDVIEISPEVVEASRFFSHVNHGALMDPRTELIIGDGRNHLRYIRGTYDVIISEPSNPWMAGMATLFTREFFNEARARLSAAGMFCQWVHSYNMATGDLRTIIATFRTAFPHAMLWMLNENDFLLLGSSQPQDVDESLMRQNFERVAADLRTVQVQDLYSVESLEILRERELDRFAAGAMLNTDDLPILEFRAPRSIHSDTTTQNFSALSALPQRVEHKATAENYRHKAEMYLAAEAFREAREEFQQALREDALDPLTWKGLVATARTGFRLAELRAFFEDRLRTAPTTVSRRSAAEFYLQETNYPRAVEILDAILIEEPNNTDALEMMAGALASQQSGRLEEIAARLVALEPENPKALFHLATLRFYQRRFDESIQILKKVLERDAKHVRARNLLAIAYGQTFQPQLAETEFLGAIKEAPDDSASYNNYGIFLLDRERIREARQQFQRAVSINPEEAQGFAGMGETFRHEGDLRRAQNWYRRALQVDPNQPVAKAYVK